MGGMELVLQISPTESVSHVKAMIQEMHPQHIAPEKQRLIFAGRVLNDHQTLADYGIEHERVIHLVVRPAVLPGSQQAAAASAPAPAPMSVPVAAQMAGPEGLPNTNTTVMRKEKR